MIIFFILCSCYYYHAEGWSIQQSITFLIVTMTTVGYGYRFPTTDRARLFTIFVICISVFALFSGVQQFVEAGFNAMKDYLHERQYKIHNEDDPTLQRVIYTCRLVFMSMLIVSSILLAGLYYSIAEDWTYITGLYFAVQTASTVGYGDLKIVKHTTHIFSGFFIIIITTFLAFAINYLAEVAREKQSIDAFEDALQLKQVTNLMELFDQRSPGSEGEVAVVYEEEFVLFMLEKLRKISRKDLELLQQHFRELDTTKSGQLTRNQMQQYQDKIRTEAGEKLVNLQDKERESLQSMIDKRGLSFIQMATTSFISSGSLSTPVEDNPMKTTRDKTVNSPKIPKVTRESASNPLNESLLSRKSASNPLNDSLLSSSIDDQM